MFEQHNDHSFEILYATFPDATSAQTVADKLIHERHVACVNIFPAVQSTYRWEGKICHETEVIMIAKTRSEKRFAAQDCIVHNHPSKVPAVVSIPIAEGHEPYLNWLIRETL